MQEQKKHSTFETRLASASWGLALLWVGIGFLTDFGWGVGFFGLGVITLATQVIRAIAKRPVEVFWVVMGTFFAGAGLFDVFSLGDFGPVALIGAGLAILVASLVGPRHRHAE